MRVTLRISTPSFVAGVIVGELAAPIVKYMARWSRKSIEDHCRLRGWGCEVVP